MGLRCVADIDISRRTPLGCGDVRCTIEIRAVDGSRGLELGGRINIGIRESYCPPTSPRCSAVSASDPYVC